MTTTQPEKKGSRFSRLLGAKRDEAPPIAPSTAPTTGLPDSAYASSDAQSADIMNRPPPPPMNRESTVELVPAEKGSEIANIDKDRNLDLKPSTGEVLDRDTGEVVTVVTTTTTTTTTTTRKPGKGNPQVHKDVQREVQEMTTPMSGPVSALNEPSDGSVKSVPQSGPAEMPANTATITQGHPPAAIGGIPDRTSPSQPLLAPAPSIPHKSLARKSGEFGTSAQAGPVDENLTAEPPLSPSNTVRQSNFSYPQRNRNSMEPDGGISRPVSEVSRPPGSTFSELKAAAKGLHGVGETLRGTLNSAIDERYPRKNADKNAYAQSKNEATLNRGRSEMGGIPYQNRPENTRTPTNEQVIPGSFSEHDDTGPVMQPGLGPQSHNLPETENSQDRKARSIGKLFKRKPVTGGGELRVTNP